MGGFDFGLLLGFAFSVVGCVVVLFCFGWVVGLLVCWFAFVAVGSCVVLLCCLLFWSGDWLVGCFLFCFWSLLLGFWPGVWWSFLWVGFVLSRKCGQLPGAKAPGGLHGYDPKRAQGRLTIPGEAKGARFGLCLFYIMWRLGYLLHLRNLVGSPNLPLKCQVGKRFLLVPL